jgi:hypothetical protein
MSAWMANLYMQQSIAGHNVNGVPVSVDAVSASGAVTHVGDTTSDAAGQFAISWVAPQATGTYTIVANFAGSNSYGASHGQTHMIVTTSSGNPIVTATPTNTPSPNAETPVALYVGIAAAVVIIAVIVAAVVLRRRK